MENPLTERVSNHRILKKIARERKQMLIIRKRQLKFFGQIMKMADITNLTLTGHSVDKRDRGEESHVPDKIL